MTQIDYKKEVSKKIEEYIEKLPGDWAERCADELGVSATLVRTYRNGTRGITNDGKVKLLRALKTVYENYENELKKLIS